MRSPRMSAPPPAILCMLNASQLPVPEWGCALLLEPTVPRHTEGQCAEYHPFRAQLDGRHSLPGVCSVVGPIAPQGKESPLPCSGAGARQCPALSLKVSLQLWEENLTLSLSWSLLLTEVCRPLFPSILPWTSEPCHTECVHTLSLRHTVGWHLFPSSPGPLHPCFHHTFFAPLPWASKFAFKSIRQH